MGLDPGRLFLIAVVQTWLRCESTPICPCFRFKLSDFILSLDYPIRSQRYSLSVIIIMDEGNILCWALQSLYKTGTFLIARRIILYSYPGCEAGLASCFGENSKIKQAIKLCNDLLIKRRIFQMHNLTYYLKAGELIKANK